MTHYYYYVIADPVCDSTSEILKVSLGTSARARRDYLFLTAYSVEHDYRVIMNLRRAGVSPAKRVTI